MRAPGSLQRLWNGEAGLGPAALGILAAPLAAVFGTAVRTRNLLYDLGALRTGVAPLPVISVGNLVVGGTGKTPVSAWLVKELERRGWSPALVTRGYGEDEVLLHRRWNPGVPVIIGGNRLRSAREAHAAGRNIVVLDDGFQHRRLKRDLDVVLISPAHPFPPRLLPRGPYREPLRALRRADIVLVTAKGERQRTAARQRVTELRQVVGIPAVETFSLEPGTWQDLDGRPAPLPPDPPLVVCSIAEPNGLLALVEARAGSAELLSFPDHHPYREVDAESITERAGTRWIATSEKDAVKLSAFRELLPPVRVLPLVPAAGDRLAERLLRSLGDPATARNLESQ